MKLARHFAERITALTYDQLPPEAVYWSKVAVMDTLGVMLAGSREEAPHIVEDVLELGGEGPCLIVGSDRRAGPRGSGLVPSLRARRRPELPVVPPQAVPAPAAWLHRAPAPAAHHLPSHRSHRSPVAR